MMQSVRIKREAKSYGRRSMIHQALEELKKSIVIRPKYDNSSAGRGYRRCGQYFSNPTPVTGRPLVRCGVSTDRRGHREKALDAAHAPRTWARPLSPSAAHPQQDRRSHGRAPARAGDGETLDNGKADPRDRSARDLPLAVDHFATRGCIRSQEGSVCEIDHTTYAYHFHEPLGVVGQIIPWNFPLLMAAWKVARRSPPATASSSSRPSRRRWGSWSGPTSSGDLLPPGVFNTSTAGVRGRQAASHQQAAHRQDRLTGGPPPAG